MPHGWDHDRPKSKLNFQAKLKVILWGPFVRLVFIPDTENKGPSIARGFRGA